MAGKGTGNRQGLKNLYRHDANGGCDQVLAGITRQKLLDKTPEERKMITGKQQENNANAPGQF